MVIQLFALLLSSCDMAALTAELQSDIDALNAALDCAHEGATDPSCPTPVTNAVDQLRVPLLAMEDSLDDLLACYPNASYRSKWRQNPHLRRQALHREKPSMLSHGATRAQDTTRSP